MFRQSLVHRLFALIAIAITLSLPFTVEASATIHQRDTSTRNAETYVKFSDGRTVTLDVGEQITVREACVAVYRAEIGWQEVPVSPKPQIGVRAFAAILAEAPSPTVVVRGHRKSPKDDDSAVHDLRALAVAAPYWVRRASDPAASRTLDSRTPFSLQNACRLAAGMATSGEGVWGTSNWNTDASLVMYDYADDLGGFETMLEATRPNLLLIGSMTLALPGAIEIARKAKELLGDTVTIVLGGKHPSETIYKKKGGNEVLHAPGSPLRIMQEGKIPECFDLVVAGDGEHVIVRLGELIAQHGRPQLVQDHMGDLGECPGNWIAGYVRHGSVQTLASRGIPVDYGTMPVPAGVFGFNASFPVFGADRTAHVYSDISRGCMYDCFFCTERQTVNGKPNLVNAADRLARQLEVVRESGKARGDRVSAFVEDSILLMGLPRELARLSELLHGLDPIPFGGQITVDLFLRDEVRATLRSLTDSGLCYLYAGMETASESIAEGMSKNVGKGEWMTRNERAIELATEMGIKFGVSLLFGLGEAQADRVRQLEELVRWQGAYGGNPCVVSLNWATQHPLLDVGLSDYIAWGTSADSELLPWFQKMFGEASELYSVVPTLPTVAELRELAGIFDRLNLNQ